MITWRYSKMETSISSENALYFRQPGRIFNMRQIAGTRRHTPGMLEPGASRLRRRHHAIWRYNA